MSAATPILQEAPETTAPAPAAAPAPAPAATPWHAGIAPEYMKHPDVVRHGDLSSLVKDFVNTKSLVGRKGVLLPKEGDAADQARFFTELGRPETPDKYDLGEFTPPDGIAIDAGLSKAFFEHAHTIGLSNAQAKSMVEWQTTWAAQQVAGRQEAAKATAAQTERELRTEFGTAYEARLHLAHRAVQSAAGEKAAELLDLELADGTILGDSPLFARAMAKIGEMFGEAQMDTDATLRTVAGQTPANAQSEISRLYGDKDFMAAYGDIRHPGHTEAHERMKRLYGFAHQAPAGK